MLWDGVILTTVVLSLVPTPVDGALGYATTCSTIQCVYKEIHV